MNNYRLKYSVLVILLLFPVFSYSQTDCTVPLPPVLTNVSVNTASGNTELRWSPSPSSNIDAYIVYVYTTDGGLPRGDVVDTIRDPAATGWSYFTNAVSYFKLNYVVASYRKPKCGSQFSNILNTIYCSTSLDTCKKELSVKWSSYADYPDSVKGYTILAAENSGALKEIAAVNALTTSYIYNDFETGSAYCFVVRANLKSGSASYSNKSCISVIMQRPPRWINADYATINSNNEIELSFTADPLSDIKTFRLERKGEGDNGFLKITDIQSSGGKITYTDKDAGMLKKYRYRLSAVNNCGNPVVYSNTTGNIVMEISVINDILNLSWNSYPGWSGGNGYYRIFMDTGNGFKEQTLLMPADTIFSVDYSDLMYEISVNQVCFYVNAFENLSPTNGDGESRSNNVCTEIIERITVPNVFTPDNDLLNDLFKPVLSFTPLSYHLVITDRNNNIVFEISDHFSAWDGTKGGSPIPQGVYLWYLKTTTPSGKTISKSGTVTVIKNR